MVAIPWDPVPTSEPTPEPTTEPGKDPQKMAWDNLAAVDAAHKALRARDKRLVDAETSPTPGGVKLAKEFKEPEVIKQHGQYVVPFEEAEARRQFVGPPPPGNRPFEGALAPVQGGSITTQTGEEQEGSSKYAIGAGFARVKEDFEADHPGSSFTIFSGYGGIRTAEDNFQRILTNKKHWVNYFTPNAIARGNPTKDDLLPGKWEDLQNSPHVHARAADIRLDADTGKYGTVPGNDGVSYPSEAAMLNSSQGQWMYRDDSYNLLIRGWVPTGKGYGGSSGITDPNTGRKELWHIEYNPEAAKKELLRLGYINEVGFLIPPAATLDPEDEETIEKSIEAGQVKTSQQRLSEMVTGVADQAKSLEGQYPNASVGQTLFRTAERVEKNQAELELLFGKMVPELQAANQKVADAQAAAKTVEAKALSVQESMYAQSAGMAEATAEAVRLNEEERVARIDSIMENIDATAEKIRGMSIDPWRQFRFVEAKLDKNGKPVLDEQGNAVTQLNPLKTAYTVAAGVALLANAFFTFKSAARKKGNKVPFLVWDMIMQAVNMDLQGQKAALDGEHAKLNSEHNRLKDWNDYFGDRETAMLQQKSLMLEYVEMKVKELTKGWEDDAAQAAVIQILETSKAARMQIAANAQEKIVATANDTARVQFHGIGARSELQTKQQSVVLKALTVMSQLTDKELKKRKLTPEQKNAQLQALKFIPKAKELIALWDKAGGDSNLLLKLAAKSGILSVLPYVPEEWDASDLSRIRELQQQHAAVLTKSMGETGALAEAEQQRAMSQIPLTDRYELGRWKLRRLLNSMTLMASDQFYVMGRRARQQLLDSVFNQPNTLSGARRSAQVLFAVTSEWKTQSIRISTASDREKRLGEPGQGPRRGKGSRIPGKRPGGTRATGAATEQEKKNKLRLEQGRGK